MIAVTQPPPHVRDILAGLYARKTGKVLPVYDMVFDEPVVNTSDQYEGNTILVATHLLGSGYFGKKTLVYDRIDLALLIPEFPIELEQTTLYDNLAVISEQFGIELTEDDVLDAPVTSTSVTLIAKETSYLYVGTGTIGQPTP